jgi:hypothetical protein
MMSVPVYEIFCQGIRVLDGHRRSFRYGIYSSAGARFQLFLGPKNFQPINISHLQPRVCLFPINDSGAVRSKALDCKTRFVGVDLHSEQTTCQYPGSMIHWSPREALCRAHRQMKCTPRERDFRADDEKGCKAGSPYSLLGEAKLDACAFDQISKWTTMSKD